MELGMNLVALEWTGSILALVGSLLIAANVKASVWGFVINALSNTCWAFYAIHTKAYGMLFMQMGFLLTAGLGIYRWRKMHTPEAPLAIPIKWVDL